ncbi:MAG: GNAT family N-acetyltransferase [Defluviitaleaceae bacterium]|nr:GNAT family N-acetyltransferase [Defluviitaleaceae bacterium]
MVELTKEQIRNARATFQAGDALSLQFALELEYALLGDNGTGKLADAAVFADDAMDPGLFFTGAGYQHLYVRGGSMKFLTDPAAAGELRSLALGRSSGDSERIFLNIYSSSAIEPLIKLFGDRIEKTIVRHNYRLNHESFGRARADVMIPEGFALKYFDAGDAGFIKGNELDENFWNEDSGRFGFALTHADEIVSDCVSVYFEKESKDADDKRVVEIGIATKELYRRRGFAFLTAAAFVGHCLANGLIPNWGHWDFKPESGALARRLGFYEISRRNVLVIRK